MVVASMTKPRLVPIVIFTACLVLCYHGNNGMDTHEYPPYDGWYNNLHNPSLGAIDTQLFRRVPPAYRDGVYEPSGHRRPNPIHISMLVFNGSSGLQSYQNRTAFLVFFGQQLVEEIMDSQRPGCPPEFFNIKIPKGHPQYDPDGRGERELPLLRTRFDQNTGSSPNAPRQQLNEITPYIDGGLMYGAAKGWSDAIRSYEGGRLAALNDSDRNEYYFPALNRVRLPFANPPTPREHVLKPISRFYLLGNPRGNENPFLLTFGVLWFRYHNYRARQLQANHPDWKDERLYNEARRWVVAVYQKIAMYDFLPAWTDSSLPPYEEYNPTINPNIAHVFQAAAMRFGHTLVPPGVYRRNGTCQFRKTTKFTKFDGHKGLRTCNTYWNSQEALQEQDIDEILMGMASQVCEREDMTVTPDLRGDLFGPLEFSRRDLMAINIQRGRDHGIQDYNSVREQYGLERKTTWESVNPELFQESPEIFEKLRELYGESLDDVDLWVGGLLESNKRGLGELFRKITLEQFGRIRDGDRFWYENRKNKLFTNDEIAEINNTTLHDVMLAVTNIKSHEIQQNPFFYKPGDPCEDKHPGPLRVEDMEECTPVEYFDYFSGSELSYALSIAGLLSTFFMGLGTLVFLAKRHQKMVKKEKEANRRRERRTKKQDTSEGEVFSVIEYLGKDEGERHIQVLLNTSSRKITIKSGDGKNKLRVIDVQLLKNSGCEMFSIVLSADKLMNMIAVQVPIEYDLVLIMENSNGREAFLKAFKEFCKAVDIKIGQPDIQEEKFIKKAMKTMTRRKKQLEHFFKNIFNHAFKYDESTPVDEVSNLLELTKIEFADSLDMKPDSLFVDNIFKFADKDNNGYLNFQEFLNIIVVFSKGSPEEKSRLMFDMYDLKGRGYLKPDQFKTMLTSFVDLANEKIEENKITHLVDTILQNIGLNSQSKIYFKDFKRILQDYESDLGTASLNIQGAPGVDRPIVRDAGAARARKTIYNAYRTQESLEEVTMRRNNNEATLDRRKRFSSVKQITPINNTLPQSKTAQRSQEIVRYIQNYRRQIFWATLYVLVCIGVFAERAYYYSIEREHAGLRQIAGYGVSVTRGAASGMMFTFSCLLVTMCRNLITFLRETIFHRYIPFDSAISFHKFIAWIAFGFTVMHIIGHCLNFYHISTQTASDLNCLFRNFFHATDVLPKFHDWMWKTITGFTGVLLTIVIFIMYTFATEYARRHAFRAFWITHNMHVILWILMILHGAGRLVQAPFFHFFFLGPVILFTLDKLVSLSRKKVEIAVLGVEHLPSGVTSLIFQRPSSFEYKSGQWVRIACLKLGDDEYHPFTLSSAPNEETLSLHIRAVGPWTHNLRRLYNPDNYDNHHHYPAIYLDGPYGEGHQDWYRYDVAILVGGGIGVTPFASILKDLAHKSKTGVKINCKKVYFIWVTRSQKQFEWMTDIIREVEENDRYDLVSCHIFITQFREKFDVRTTMLYICERNFQKISGRSLFTGLRSVTHFGRPDFRQFFEIMQEEHPDVNVFGVFSCGPPPMTLGVDKACGLVNKFTDNTLFIHHFENF